MGILRKMRERGTNPRVRRFFCWSTFFIAVVISTIYGVTGSIDVPEESPLSDPNYVLRQLNDATIPWGTELPPGTITPVNMLNNGEPVMTLDLVLQLVLYVLVILGSLYNKDTASGILALTFTELNAMKLVAETLVNIPFECTHLRSMAQPLIDGSHRLRVIFAYIQLECERRDLHMASAAVDAWCVSIVLGSFLLAGVIEYARWREDKRTA